MLTKQGATLGTIAYMSPEQTRGDQADQRTDIWSLGVVLYEMASGEKPFKGDYEQAVLYSILNEEVSGLDNIPAGIGTVIDKCLCGDVFKSRKTDHLTDTGRKDNRTVYRGIGFDILAHDRLA